MKVLIIGNRGGTNIGGCFERAASELRLKIQLIESRLVMEAPQWVRRFNWWCRGHRPTRLNWFGKEILRVCHDWNPDCFLAIGIAPLNEAVLNRLGSLGIRRLNYLTDDPWNPAHRAPWFMKALPFYDHVFSVRRSNLGDLKQLGCRQVSYLPFAYAPELHYPESPLTADERAQFESDVVFVGGADRDRISYLRALIQTGFRISLYGGYWTRFRDTRNYAKGYADVRTLRLATGGAKVALCLVRRANRDGNSMRSFEIPAIGTCMLTEDTEEHREIFGEDGKAVVYFQSITEMIEKLRWLLQHDEGRSRFAEAAHRLILKGHHTYKDRLLTMLRSAEVVCGGRGL